MTETGPGRARDIIDLLRDHGNEWQIDVHPGGLDIFSATRRSADGRHIHVLIAHAPAELRDKIQSAELPTATEYGRA